MKIVIDILEEIYKEIKENRYIYEEDVEEVALSILCGTPLPKGHGRLVDADAYQIKLEEKAKRLNNLDTINGLCGAVALLYDTETIIEADKGDIEK